MFRNALTANDKYPVRDCENLSSPIQMQFSLKPKTFSGSFVPFLESTSNFKHFEKENDRQVLYFGNYRLSKTWLDHSLKNILSEHPLTVNMLKGTKLLENQRERNFIIFFHHCERT